MRCMLTFVYKYVCPCVCVFWCVVCVYVWERQENERTHTPTISYVTYFNSFVSCIYEHDTCMFSKCNSPHAITIYFFHYGVSGGEGEGGREGGGCGVAGYAWPPKQ